MSADGTPPGPSRPWRATRPLALIIDAAMVTGPLLGLTNVNLASLIRGASTAIMFGDPWDFDADIGGFDFSLMQTPVGWVLVGTPQRDF